MLPPAVRLLQQARPRIRVAILAMDNVGVVDTFVEERVDFGLVLSPLSLPAARLVELCSAELMCVVHPAHALAPLAEVTPADIAPHPLISFSLSLPLGALVDRVFRESGHPRRIAFEVNQSSVACALARAGVGVAIVDPFWVIEHGLHGLVRLNLRPSVTVNAQALVPQSAPLSRPARMLLATIRKAAGSLQAGGAFSAASMTRSSR